MTRSISPAASSGERPISRPRNGFDRFELTVPGCRLTTIAWGRVLDISIAADDNLLKTALSPHYPSIKNASITRETRAGQMIVSIVKKAEHKGKSGE